MKNIVNFVIKNKLAVWLLTFIITFSGVYASTQMKTETIPDITIPYLMVMGVYPGATPEKVMDEVSIPLEKAIEGLEHVKAVYSNSSSNIGNVQIEYEYGIDMDEAKRALTAAIENVTLPDSVKKPTVVAISLDMTPVISMSVSSEKEDIASLTTTVENTLLPQLEKVDGVGAATITGQHVEKIEVVYDQQKLEQLGITEEMIKQMIQANDVRVSLGLYDFKEGQQAVAVDGKLMTLDTLKGIKIPVTTPIAGQAPFVSLKDVATFNVVGDVESISRTNGKEAISIQITKEQQANTVDVVNAVKELIAEQEKKVDGLVVDITLDQGKPIEDSISTMVEKAVFGGLIAVLIILLFLRDVKSTIISIISIPVSIFMALLLLYWLDITLNMMTLGAITVAIGRVIDDSIVVVENIYRRMHLKEEKLTGRALVREATIEMFKPILSSTLVTVAVFAPLVFVGGMVGELFMPFALTMTFALGASLLVAITIVPALSHFLFKKKLYGEKETITHHKVGVLGRTYKQALTWSLNHKIITLSLSILLFIGSLALTPFIGFSFMGSEEDKMISISYVPKAGDTMEQTLQNIEFVEKELLKRKDLDVLQLSISDGTDFISTLSGKGAGSASMYAIFDPEVPHFEQVKEEIETYLSSLDHSGEWSSQGVSSVPLASNELSYTFRSEDLTTLTEAAKKVEEILMASKDLEKVTSTAQEAYIEHVLHVDQQRLLPYGLTTIQLVGALAPQYTQDVLTTISKDDKSIQVVIAQEKKSKPTSIEAILQTQIQTALGTTVPLSELVTVEEGTTLNTLKRNGGMYYATVSGTVIGDDVSKVSAAMAKKVEAIDLPKGVEMDVGGVTKDMIEAFTQLGLAMVAAILIVYFILVVTFGEGVAPFAILFSLPFAVIGSFIGLLLVGETISVPVMMGLLMLIGIVVTNAIVLVDRIIQTELQGTLMREAVIEAGVTRLRPILMTAIATIGALLPLALGSGGGGFISKGLGVTVIGGLVSSTLLTLIVVPIAYEILSKLFKKDRKNRVEN